MTGRPALKFLTLAVMLQTSLVAAQGESPENRFASVPQIGELIPDIEIVDQHGYPVRLRDLTRGHYTVMTLGCLT